MSTTGTSGDGFTEDYIEDIVLRSIRSEREGYDRAWEEDETGYGDYDDGLEPEMSIEDIMTWLMLEPNQTPNKKLNQEEVIRLLEHRQQILDNKLEMLDRMLPSLITNLPVQVTAVLELLRSGFLSQWNEHDFKTKDGI